MKIQIKTLKDNEIKYDNLYFIYVLLIEFIFCWYGIYIAVKMNNLLVLIGFILFPMFLAVVSRFFCSIKIRRND